MPTPAVRNTRASLYAQEKPPQPAPGHASFTTARSHAAAAAAAAATVYGSPSPSSPSAGAMTAVAPSHAFEASELRYLQQNLLGARRDLIDAHKQVPGARVTDGVGGVGGGAAHMVFFLFVAVDVANSLALTPSLTPSPTHSFTHSLTPRECVA